MRSRLHWSPAIWLAMFGVLSSASPSRARFKACTRSHSREVVSNLERADYPVVAAEDGVVAAWTNGSGNSVVRVARIHTRNGWASAFASGFGGTRQFCCRPSTRNAF
jgi:hypothetical protein